MPTTVALRPILPFLSTDDIDEIVDATRNFTHGYLSGPLYLTDEIKKYFVARHLSYPTEVREVAWLPGRPSMEVIESPELERHLARKASQYALPLFESNVDAVMHLKDKLLRR